MKKRKSNAPVSTENKKLDCLWVAFSSKNRDYVDFVMKVQHKRIQNKLTFKKNTEEVWTESKQNVIISRGSRHPYDKLYGVNEVLANQKQFRQRTLFARGSR